LTNIRWFSRFVNTRTWNAAMLTPKDYNRLVTQQLSEPVVFKNKLQAVCEDSSEWRCIRWSDQQWLELFKEEPLKVRFGRLKSEADEPQWEGTCPTSTLKFSDILAWSKTSKADYVTDDGDKVEPSTHWAYYDYVYMKDHDVLSGLADLVSWRQFGFASRGLDESSLWVGTAGSYTPCHQDTFGCNLVAQLRGRKRWTLLSPDCDLYDTRVPYEESSVYSKVDFTAIDAQRFALMKGYQYKVVILEPGDVLFVPKHWWHFAEAMDFSISINTWIELQSDVEDKVKEAIVQQKVASICMGIDSTDVLARLLNPNMFEIVTSSAEYLNECITARMDEFICSEYFTRKFGEASVQKISRALVSIQVLESNHIEKLESLSFEDYVNLRESESLQRETSPESRKEPSKLNKISERSNSAFLLEIYVESATCRRVIKQAFDELVKGLQAHKTLGSL